MQVIDSTSKGIYQAVAGEYSNGVITILPTTMAAPVGLAKRFGESLFVNVSYASAGDHSVSGAGVTWKF